jgi:hypothetical protein
MRERWKLRERSLVFVLIAFSIQLQAQEPSEASWENLNQIQVGQMIEVVRTNLTFTNGPLLHITDEAIVLRVKDNDVDIQRGDVLRVSRLDTGKRKRNMMIGLGVGVGAGVLIGAAAASPYFDEGTGFKPGAIILTTAGVGAALGLALGAHSGFQTVYRVARRPAGAAP